MVNVLGALVDTSVEFIRLSLNLEFVCDCFETTQSTELIKKIVTILLNSSVQVKADLDPQRFTIKNRLCGSLIQVIYPFATPLRLGLNNPHHLGFRIFKRGIYPHDRLLLSKRLGSLYTRKAQFIPRQTSKKYFASSSRRNVLLRSR